MDKGLDHSLFRMKDSTQFDSTTIFPYGELRRYLKILVECGIVVHLDASQSSAALKIAAKIANNHASRSIYELGALDVIRIADNLDLEDIRYALTRAKCPVAKSYLK